MVVIVICWLDIFWHWYFFQIYKVSLLCTILCTTLWYGYHSDWEFNFGIMPHFELTICLSHGWLNVVTTFWMLLSVTIAGAILVYCTSSLWQWNVQLAWLWLLSESRLCTVICTVLFLSLQMIVYVIKDSQAFQV